MNKDQFNKLYNPHNRCTVTYIDRHNDTVKGLLLDDIKSGGYVYINNFVTRVSIDNLITIVDTGKPWIQ